MAPSITGSARIVAASETAARRSRRLVRTVDLQPDEMVEQVDRGGEGEAEEVVEVESGIEEDGGAIIEPAPEPSLSHLREISSLASWTVSTYKPGCGIPALLSSSTSQFWQSDGPQPHLLNIHFFKLVHIVKLRVYLDFTLDESYTPTRMLFLAGMGMYDLTEFAEWSGEEPKGWVDVPLEGVGGGEDGNVLRAMLVQIRVCENHQNGKDTHVRGVQVFAMDERGPKGVRRRGKGRGLNVNGSATHGAEIIHPHGPHGAAKPNEPTTTTTTDIIMNDAEAESQEQTNPHHRQQQQPSHPTATPPTSSAPIPTASLQTMDLGMDLDLGLEEAEWMGSPQIR